MSQAPECVVCLQLYDDSVCVPRVLGCGHSFCELCLQELQSSWNPSISSSSSSSKVPQSGGLIRCPECNHRTRLPIGGLKALPKNIALIRLLPSRSTALQIRTGGESGTSDGGKDAQSRRDEGPRGSSRGARRFGARDDTGGLSKHERGSKGKGRDDGLSTREMERINFQSNSYYIPCDLQSRVSSWNSRPWIVPRERIKLRNDCRNGLSRLASAELHLEQDRSNSRISVSLLEIELTQCETSGIVKSSKVPREDETLSYEDLALRAWERIDYESQIELSSLFQISAVCHHVCRIFGLFMSEQSELYLVSEKIEDQSTSAWDLLKTCTSQAIPAQTRSIQNHNAHNAEGNSVESKGNGETGARNAPSVDIVEILTRVGLGICEILLEVHSHGLILGLLSPQCVTCDQFDNFLLDLNGAVSIRRRLGEVPTKYKSHTTELKKEEENVEVDPVDSLDTSKCCDCVNCSRYSGQCWEYLSPEVLSLVISDFSTDGRAGNGTGGSDKASEIGTRVTRKSDSWSLGCLILELVTGKSPFVGLSFPQIVQHVLVEKGKPRDLQSLESLEWVSDPSNCILIDHRDRVEGFKKILLKCFDHDETERPDVSELYHTFKELHHSSSFYFSIFSKHNTNKSVYSDDQHNWVLCLPRFRVDRSLNSGYEEKAEVQKEESESNLGEILEQHGEASGEAEEQQSWGLKLGASLEGHDDYVTALVTSGDYLVSASFDKTVRVWSLESDELLVTWEGHSQVILALAVDEGSFRCFSGDNSGKICVWTLEPESLGTNDLPLIATWQEHDDWRYTGVASLAIAEDGVLYSGSGDRTIKAWSSQTFDLIGTMEGHTSIVSALVIDGELLYSGSWDGTVRVWWRSDHSLMASLGPSLPAMGAVRSLCMSDRFLFAGREDGSIQVWKGEEYLGVVKAHNSVVSAVCVMCDFLCTGSWDQRIKVWRVDSFLSDPSPAAEKDCGAALLALVADGHTCYVGLAEKAVKLYELEQPGR